MMSPDDLCANTIDTEIFNSPAEAPNYLHDKRIRLKLAKADVVKKGTKGGKPTVDLHFVDQEGNRYITMTTSALLKTIGSIGVE